jgi:hypothetical protein
MGPLLFVTLKTSHLSGLNCMSQVDSHCCKASRSFCKILVSSELLIFRYSRQSSANNRAVAVTVSSAKDMRLNFSHNLSWNTHISSVAKKANNNRVFLSRNISSCPKKIKAQCYLTLVRPIMEYACVVWDPRVSYIPLLCVSFYS